MAKNKIDIQTIDKSIDENVNNVTCAFCGRNFGEENTMKSGINFLLSSIHKNLGICDVCLDTFYETNQLLRSGEGDENSEHNLGNVDIGTMEEYLPSTIKEKLDEYIIGQERAKKVLASAAYNHIKRINNMDLELEKSNVLLIGPSGCGKTYLVETLAKILKVPCETVNITAYSETGYKGKDPIEILKNLCIKANGNVALAERGIVFIDEIDKIANIGEGTHIGDTKIQQSLLKMVEGCEEIISDETGFNTFTINTKNILFIFAGAFVGIEEHQKGNKASSGFISSNVSTKGPQTLQRVTAKNLIDYGMIPEFVGRVPKIVTLNPLTKEELISIMKNAKNSSYRQFQTSFKIDGYDIEFAEETFEEIANECIKTKLGARALKSIIDDTMEELEFSLPGTRKIKGKGKRKKIIITKDMVINREN